MKADPLSGDLFLFTNRRRTRAKVLLWDGTGLCVYQKRLERGRFAPLWRRSDEETFEMTLSELALFLEGSTLAGAVRLSPAPTPPEGGLACYLTVSPRSAPSWSRSDLARLA